MFEYTGRLFARPSFAEGMGRILDFGGFLNEYNYSASGAEADDEALRADFRAVAEDFQEVIRNYRKALSAK